LTEAQLNERRDALVQKLDLLVRAEMEKRAMMAARKAYIEQLEKEIDEIAKEIRQRAELREVEVMRRKNFIDSVEETIRLDTHEVVHTRALTPDERQAELKLVDNEKWAAAKKTKKEDDSV
jgi:hypothetical protein